MQNLFSGVIKLSIYLLVFLIPLFWLPFSFEAYEFNKQYLLFFLVSLALFSWLGKMILAGEVRFRKTPLDIFVFGFLFVAVLSAIFSVDKSSSLFGFYGRFSDGLIGLLSLGALYFLITNNVNSYGLKVGAASLANSQESLEKDKKLKTKNQTGSQDQKLITVDGLMKVFSWSVFFVVLISYLAIFGVWDKLSFLPKIMSQKIFNPVAGSLEGLAIFLAVILVFLTGLLLVRKGRSLANFVKWSLWLAILGLLVMIDFNSAWLILLASLVLFLVFALWKRIFKDNVNRLLLPILLIVIAGLGFTIANFKIPSIDFQLPREQVLGQGISWPIGFKAAAENAKTGFLGTGIGTFHYDFAKEKSVSFNQSRLWQIRFDRAGSYLTEVMATMGFLGVFSYLALLSMFFLLAYFLLEKNSNQLPLLMAFTALAVGQFFYYQNTVLAFAFWLTLGLSVVSRPKPIEEKVFSFKNFPELNLVFTTILIILGIVLAASYYFGARFYLADKNFSRSNFAKAVELNPFQPQYLIILARSYLNEALLEVQKPVGEKDEAVLQLKVAKAIDTAKTAAEKGRGQVAAFETLAMVYRDISGIASGARDWAIDSFQKAIDLEPTNPVLRTELAKMFLTTEPNKAKEYLTKAKELKPDYIDALIQEVIIYEREENLEEAVKIMEKLAQDYPFNIELAFQLGRLYFNADRVDESVALLSRLIQLAPNHSNALYSLAVAYQKKGDLTMAKRYLNRVLELNPSNEEIKARLKELEK